MSLVASVLVRHCGQKREDMDPFRQFCSEVVSNVSETGFRVVSLSARLGGEALKMPKRTV